MAAADGKSDNGRRGAPSLEKKEILKPRFSGPNPRSKTTFWTKSKEHDNNNKQNLKIKSIGSIEGSSVSALPREMKLNGTPILNFWVNNAIMYVNCWLRRCLQSSSNCVGYMLSRLVESEQRLLGVSLR